MKKIFLPITIILFLTNSSCAISNGEVKKMAISKEQAVEIANRELSKQDFDIKEKNINVDEYNKLWNERYLSNDKFKRDNPNIIEKLKDKDYWSIHYTPKEMGKMFGGGAWVFVDKNNGEIILLFYEK